MGRMYRNPNDKYRGLHTQTVRSIAALERQSLALRGYMLARKASEERADTRDKAEAASRREQMLDVAKAVPVIAKQQDKRTVPSHRGKKVKTRTRRTAQQLRLTRTRRPRKIKYR